MQCAVYQVRRWQIARWVGVLCGLVCVMDLYDLAAKDRQELSPVPSTGATDAFHYQREGDRWFRIIPTDGAAAYRVSEGFLRTTLSHAALDSAQQAALLRSYPALMAEAFTALMASAYPDSATMFEDTPFAARVLQGEGGLQVVLTQDPVAGPYVRVALRTAEGRQETFSLAREIVEQLLGRAGVSEAQVVASVRAFPFRLPEAARTDQFASLTAEDLAQVVLHEPRLQHYEAIAMTQYYRERDRTARATATAGAARNTEAQAPPSPPAGIAPLQPAGLPADPRARPPLQEPGMHATPPPGVVRPLGDAGARPRERPRASATVGTTTVPPWLHTGIIVGCLIVALGAWCLAWSQRSP